MITCFHHTAPAGIIKQILLVMLSGGGLGADEFSERGMGAALRARGSAADIVAAQPAFEVQPNRRVADALHEVVVGPALSEGDIQISLRGVSLGGMHAPLYATRYLNHVHALVQLAPFLRAQGPIAAVAGAGGFAFQSAPSAATTVMEGAC